MNLTGRCWRRKPDPEEQAGRQLGGDSFNNAARAHVPSAVHWPPVWTGVSYSTSQRNNDILGQTINILLNWGLFLSCHRVRSSDRYYIIWHAAVSMVHHPLNQPPGNTKAPSSAPGRLCRYILLGKPGLHRTSLEMIVPVHSAPPHHIRHCTGDISSSKLVLAWHRINIHAIQ